MDFLVDVHLPISLSKYLAEQPNCTSIHVNQILQKWNTSDKAICEYADLNTLVVVSKDSDFLNSHLINKTPKKLIRIVLGNIRNNELVRLFANHLSAILAVQNDEFYLEMSKEQIVLIA